ncbi:hypothetical protein LSH36_495g02032 [Paralvinella palmiformis]|uniref:Uncharacterized protein n=1 Tax=Paralvinella palmiformis TaxID=53620 RepID=A0AAD9J998_9ANNE|nr:hypothetical protein LSH36_495g02032 [Paralvinella palmiformis]
MQRPGFWIEVMVTEDVNIFDYRVIKYSALMGGQRTGGLKKNPVCRICNI